MQKYWGYSSFRPLQESIINSALAGIDTLALLPTGGGKSLCFQIPALAKDGLCLVISPLIALMKDQVQNLQNKGISATAIHSGMNEHEVNEVLDNLSEGKYKFLYVSPERLETIRFKNILSSLNICLLAIDEAHCISQWGHDFRPSYRKIKNLRFSLGDVPVIALTASATPDVQKDICYQLYFKNHKIFQQSFERPNLSYSVLRPEARENKLIDILTKVKGSAIVYCKSRGRTKHLSDLINLHKIKSDYYHAGLPADERALKQEEWIEGKTRVIVCTNAFGMGIDKPDVRLVIHFDMPDSVENYYQEAGRAGRDGKKSYAVLLLAGNEKETLISGLEQRFPTSEMIRKTYFHLMDFLGVAAGLGEGMSYDFDLSTFCRNFNLNVIDTSYAIQAMVRGGLIFFNEDFFRPSTTEFICDKNAINDFDEQYQPLIKGLLRSYEGVFDRRVYINEVQLAEFISWPVDHVKKGLELLHLHKIISYSAQGNKPSVTLLLNRMYSDDYFFDLKSHFERKEIYRKKIEDITAYSTLTTCRSIFIANYFNDKSGKNCRICDNCILNHSNTTDSEFIKMSKDVLKMITEKEIDAKELISHFPEKMFWTIIKYLESENLVIHDGAGKIKRKNV